MKFSFIVAAAIGSGSAAVTTPAQSQEATAGSGQATSASSGHATSAGSGHAYPERPVRVLVGLAPGGGTDTIARIMTQKLAEAFGQSFVVDNRPSAGGNVAGEMAARATPDGYTLITVSPTHVVNPSLWKDLRYDALRDFSPIILLVYTSYVLSVRTSLPVNSVKELVAYAKTQPQKLSYASTGIGSANHLSGELFKSMAGIDMIHVPYKGGAPALSALLGGEVQVMFSSSGGLLPHIKAGRVRALGVTGPKRATAAPDIPTIAEAGVPGFEVLGWYGFAAPARTPKPIVDKLNSTINRQLPEVKDRYAALGLELSGGTPAEFGVFLKSEFEKWARVVKISGAKVE